MAFLRAASEVLAIYTLVFTIFSPAVLEAQSLSLAAAPAPSRDGNSPPIPSFTRIIEHFFSSTL